MSNQFLPLNIKLVQLVDNIINELKRESNQKPKRATSLRHCSQLNRSVVEWIERLLLKR